MSNKKQREALQGFLTAMEQGLSLHLAAEYAKQALTTTEPEPTGMPELPPISTWTTPVGKIKAYTADNVHAYGEQCWKAGYTLGKSIKSL